MVLGGGTGILAFPENLDFLVGILKTIKILVVQGVNHKDFWSKIDDKNPCGWDVSDEPHG